MEDQYQQATKKIISRNCLQALPELYQEIAAIAEKRGLIELV
jgi:hypothetical protein